MSRVEPSQRTKSVEVVDPTKLGSTDLLLLLMTLIWGSNFTAIKYSLEDLLPLSFNAVRFTIATGVMLIVMAATRGYRLKLAPGDGIRLFLLGLLGNTCYQSLFISGMAHTRAGNAALILATTPLFTAVLGRIQKHEYFKPKGVAGLVLAFAGIILIVVSGRGEITLSETLLGDSLLLASTVCWAVYTVGSKKLMQSYGATKVTTMMMTSGTPFLLLVCTPSLLKQDWSRVRPIAWTGVVYSGLFAIALAYLIWGIGVKKIGSTRTAIYSNITPIIALLVAWPALGETPTWGQLAGAAVIFGGIYLVRHGMIAVSPEVDSSEDVEELTATAGKN
jgi:drug/metabolite transporter (DMT)-like permease